MMCSVLDREACIQKLVNSAISAVMPDIFIPKNIRLTGQTLTIKDSSFDISSFRHVYIVSIGKAAAGMALELDRIIHDHVTEGIILTKHIPVSSEIGKHYRILKGGHPVPNAGSIAGAKAIIDLLEKADASDLVIFLISGGGSALMTLPADGLDLKTFQQFSRSILSCGASINEFNTLRKHLDNVKGGRLSQYADPARQITIILSDVVGSPIDVIASGPTVPDTTTYTDALDILNRYEKDTKFPKIIRETLERGCAGEIPETLKPNTETAGKREVFVLASNRTAAFAAAETGEKLGLKSNVVNTHLTGEASSVGEMLPSFCSELEPSGLLVFGGETTVHLKGSGLGGRNQELALAAVRPMANYPGCALVTTATDGEDGPTDAAGAIVTSETLSKALELGCTPEEYLNNNDSYHFFERIGGLIRTGPSGTNVNDLTFLINFG